MIELYAKLKFNKGYNRHPCSLFRILRKLGFYKDIEKKLNLIYQNLMTLQKI